MKKLMQSKVCIVIVSVMICGVFACPVFAKSRRLQVGGAIPEFSGRTIDGDSFEYDSGNKKVLLLSFLRAGQDNSGSAAEDLLHILGGLKCEPDDIDFVVVGNKIEVKEFFVKGGASSIKPKIILDPDFKIWGAFGIIACPTVIVGDSAGKVLSVKAGHSFDFAPVIQARLKQALGIKQEIDPEKASEVKTLTNNTEQARAERNVQMAKVLSGKGKYEFALSIANKALEIDPNSVDAKLMLGRLYCQLDDGKAALAAIDAVVAVSDLDKAELALISGWANRRISNFHEAEKSLLKAIKINPLSPRVHFELGNLYQQTNQNKKANQAYQSALQLLLGKER